MEYRHATVKLRGPTLSWIGAQVGVPVVNAKDDALMIDSFVIDTRHPFSPNSLFVALKGKNFDGHDYLPQAVEAGAKCLLLSEKKEGLNVAYFLVPDTLIAFQKIAAAWRAHFENLNLIAVTGSNGKTFVKDLLASFLTSEGDTYRSPGSFNSQTGVALSLLELREHHRFAVIEAGISLPGEMEKLEKMIRPDFGIWVNLGDAHIGGLGSREGIAREKYKLFQHCKGRILFPQNSKEISFYEKQMENPRAIKINSIGPNRFTLNEKEFEINVPGLHNQMNAALALELARELGVNDRQLYDTLKHFKSAKLRLEMHTTVGGVTLLNDCYNADPTSVKSALASLAHYGEGRHKVVVLGDMLDLGSYSEQAHLKIGREIAGIADRLFLIGRYATFVEQGAKECGMDASNISIHASQQSLSKAIKAQVKSGDYLLFKASRSMELDKVATTFFQSLASTRLEIDLDIIANNVHELRNLIGKNCGLLAVIKSFAYGSDSTRVAQTLVNNGVDGFVIAFPDEGQPLRERGIKLPIIVTNVTTYEVDKIVEYSLEAVVSKRKVVDAISEATQGRDGENIGLHIEVDTGMNRLGLHPSEVLDFANYILGTPHVRITGIMTHLAAADDPQEDDFTRQQLERFEALLRTLLDKGIALGKVHIANTAGAIRFPQARRDGVRVGLGIYGFSPSPSVRAKLSSALSMRTRIIDIRDVKKGESVGYGRSWVASRASRIGTIACGYNDGFPRFMSNGGLVLVGGERVEVVGRVCMDVSMIDLTDVENVQDGDTVIIFGKQGEAEIRIEEIAERGGTINYEILTGISSRVQRFFLKT